jgi:hypothetical protein
VAAALIGIAALGSAWMLGQGLRELRVGDRYVTVKGLAERDVGADLAIWPLRFVATGNELAEVQRKTAADAQAVRSFLTEAGIPEAAIELQNFEVTDLYAQLYRSGPVENRFVVAQTLMVRTEDVDRVAALRQRVTELADKGVVLSSEGGPFAGPASSSPASTTTRPR